MTVPDVQALRSIHTYKLTRVGVTGIQKPLTVRRPGHDAPTHLVARFDAFVDLPAEQRGTHMSRNVEAINEAIDRHARETTGGLENLAAGLVRDLLDRHEYASVAEVEVEADYFRERRTPLGGAPTLERYGLVAKATATRGDDGGEARVRKAIGVAVTGMSACPCAMEGSRQMLSERGADVADIPTVTHNQRNTTFLMVESDGANGDLEADDLIDLAEASLSAPTFEYLKRGDEATLVMQAHENPRFVEDIVREVLDRVLKRYPDLPDDSLVTVKSEAEESIHKHNAFAERVTTMEELRR